MYLLKEFEENPKKIWDSNIFGKSLHALVNEGLHNKLYRMPQDLAQHTVEQICLKIDAKMGAAGPQADIAPDRRAGIDDQRYPFDYPGDSI